MMPLNRKHILPFLAAWLMWIVAAGQDGQVHEILFDRAHRLFDEQHYAEALHILGA